MFCNLNMLIRMASFAIIYPWNMNNHGGSDKILWPINQTLILHTGSDNVGHKCHPLSVLYVFPPQNTTAGNGFEISMR